MIDELVLVRITLKMNCHPVVSRYCDTLKGLYQYCVVLRYFDIHVPFDLSFRVSVGYIRLLFQDNFCSSGYQNTTRMRPGQKVIRLIAKFMWH